MIDTTKLIAIEEHWMLPELAAALTGKDESLALNRHGDIEARLEDLGAGRLATMDAQGIDLSIIALTPPGTQALDAETAMRLARDANDTASAAVARHPQRLRALATLPMSAPDLAPGELARAADRGHVGAMVYCHADGLGVEDPVYDPLWAAAARRRLPIFLHPQLPTTAQRDATYRGFDPTTDLALASFGWGWHVAAATAALRLILRGTFERHPGLQVILGHWGELLLFWLDRADGLARAARLPRLVSDYVRANIHVTASGMLDGPKLDHVRTATGPDRLLFSTDYPFQRPDRDAIASFLNRFDPPDRSRFAADNAQRLFAL